MATQKLLNKYLETRMKGWAGFFVFAGNLAFTILITHSIRVITQNQGGWMWQYTVIAMIIVILAFYAVNKFALHLVEGYYANRITNDPSFRRKIVGKHNFIEGRWVVRTKNGDNTIEYALVRITHSQGDLHIFGDLYFRGAEKEQGNTLQGGHFGRFYSEATKFISETSEFKYSFARESTYEKSDYEPVNTTDDATNTESTSTEDDDCVDNTAASRSFGAGTYTFEPLVDGKRVSFIGSYFDPRTDSLHMLEGFNIDHIDYFIEQSATENGGTNNLQAIPKRIDADIMKQLIDNFDCTITQPLNT